MLAAALVVATLAIMSTPLIAHAQGQRPVQAATTGSALYAQPPLDGLGMTMAYNRMNGSTPDFRPLAERSGAYLNATAFDKPTILTREIARLEGLFRTFDLDRTYSMRVGVNIEQYDLQRQGYPLNFGATSVIQLSDPATFHGYSLTFRNADDVSLLPIGDATAARTFSQAHDLETQGQIAGQAILQLAYRLADSPPTLGGGSDTVRADILAARLLSRNGQVLHDFGSLASQAPTAARVADGAPAIPVLKIADLQGFHIGMSEAEAEALGVRGWATKVGPNGSNIVAFFNGMTPKAPTWARCGSLDYGTPDPMAMFAGVASPPAFTDCLAAKLGGDAAAGASRTVDALASRQHLGDADPEKLTAALRGKYGAPTYVRNNGTNLVWLGRDPTRLDASPLQITADVHNEARQPGGHDTVLTVDIAPYVDPHPKPIVQSATPSAPKL